MPAIRRPWSAHEIAQLRKMAEKFSEQEIAKKLGRSEAAIHVEAWKLGISVRSKAVETAPSPTPTKEKGRIAPERVELVVAPAAIERALSVYEQLQPHDPSVILQARKILTEHIFGMVDQGEQDEQRLTVGGLAHLKAVERDHAIKSAHVTSKKNGRSKASAALTVRGASRKVSA